MQILITETDGVPIYLQIVNQIKHLVASGRLRQDEELPSIRALAEQLLINPNTVARAYRELEVAGTVTKKRTTGSYISQAASPLAKEERLRILSTKVDGLLVGAKQLSVPVSEVIDLIHQRETELVKEPK